MLTALEALETPALDEDKFMLDSQGTSRKIAAGFENLPDLLSARRRSFSGDVSTFDPISGVLRLFN